jgi:hypothetical protein
MVGAGGLNGTIHTVKQPFRKLLLLGRSAHHDRRLTTATPNEVTVAANYSAVSNTESPGRAILARVLSRS